MGNQQDLGKLFVRESPLEFAKLAERARFVGSWDISTHNFDRFIVRRGWVPEAILKDWPDAEFRPLRFHVEHLSSAELDEIRSGSVFTSVGTKLSKEIKGEVVLELASGYQGSVFEKWTKLFGGRQYIGVDLIANDSHTKDDNFESMYVKSDMLTFISRLADASVGVINLNGLEGHSSDAYRYAGALDKEIARVLKPGGMLILDDLSHGLLSPESNGINQVFPYDEWYQLQRTRALPACDQGFANYGYWQDFRLFQRIGSQPV